MDVNQLDILKINIDVDTIIYKSWCNVFGGTLTDCDDTDIIIVVSKSPSGKYEYVLEIDNTKKRLSLYYKVKEQSNTLIKFDSVGHTVYDRFIGCLLQHEYITTCIRTLELNVGESIFKCECAINRECMDEHSLARLYGDLSSLRSI